MKKYLASLMLFAAALGWSSMASAVVISGSTYSFYLQGSASGAAVNAITEFDNLAAGGVRNGLDFLVRESETALDGSSNHISINLSANGDLFPVSGETAILALGSEDALDLDHPVSLVDVRVVLRSLTGEVLFSSDNLASEAGQTQPWNGSFLAPGAAFGVEDIGGLNVASITFDFIVTDIATDVPEPGSVLLCGLGLMVIAAARRRTRA